MGYLDKQVQKSKDIFFDTYPEILQSIQSGSNYVDIYEQEENRKKIKAKVEEEKAKDEEKFLLIEKEASLLILRTPALIDWFEKVLIPLSVPPKCDEFDIPKNIRVQQLQAEAIAQIVNRIEILGGKYGNR